MEPKALPDHPAKRVTWRGQQYDSQLEADWAASLTAWGMDFRYHPGVIYLSVDRWEPDYQVEGLHEDVIFEVKGEHNHRIEKPLEARKLGYNVVIGRSAVVLGDNEVEFAVASWEGDHVIVRRETGDLVFAPSWAEDLFDEVYYSAAVALERGATAIRAFKAIGQNGIV